MPSSTRSAGLSLRLTPGVCVAFHESRYRPDAHNSFDPGAGSFGIMQIEAWWALSVEDGGPRAGFPRFDLSRAFEPVYNISRMACRSGVTLAGAALGSPTRRPVFPRDRLTLLLRPVAEQHPS